jgi:hypothetical protein
LRLHRNAALPFNVQLVQDLLVSPFLNGARELEETVTERAFAMIDMSNDAEIAEALNWDGSNSTRKLWVCRWFWCRESSSGGVEDSRLKAQWADESVCNTEPWPH